jgi:hypothetical protein
LEERSGWGEGRKESAGRDDADQSWLGGGLEACLQEKSDGEGIAGGEVGGDE